MSLLLENGDSVLLEDGSNVSLEKDKTIAGMDVKNKLTDLKTIFNSVKEIIFRKKQLTVAEVAAESLDMDMELPVISDGVTFNTGDVDLTRIRITTREVWTARGINGDPDITFQVASLAGVVNDLFLTKVGDVANAAGLIKNSTYKGAAYSLDAKKVTGSLVMFSEDRQTIIAILNAEIYASLVVADGDNPAYFNISVTPLKNSDGAELVILEKTDAAQGASEKGNTEEGGNTNEGGKGGA